MQLDRTQIVIRPRTVWDLLDLALRVTRIYFQPLVTQTLLAILPLAVLNYVSLHWILAEEQTAHTHRVYLLGMTLLIALQAPIASLPTTLLLGRVMFRQPIDPRSIWSDLRKLAWRILWVQGVWRAGIVVIWLALYMRWNQQYSTPLVILVGLSCYAFALRAGRPFINEIMLLERAPIQASRGLPLTISRRSSLLHGASSGELLLRWFMSAVAIAILSINMILACWFLSSMLTSTWQWNFLMVEIAVPACLWSVSLYATVFRFLSYLDIRIRNEGWEVELSIKAAAQELRGAA